MVKTGIEAGDTIEVISGLLEGDMECTHLPAAAPTLTTQWVVLYFFKNLRCLFIHI